MPHRGEVNQTNQTRKTITNPQKSKPNKPMETTHKKNLITVALACMVVFIATKAQAADPLASWNDGPAKQAIVEFVKATTTQGSPQLYRPRSALPRLIRTARCGSSIRCIPR